MKAILEFNLPEEQPEFELANDGYKWQLVVWELDQWLRSQIKYEPEEMSQEVYDAYELCRDKLHYIKEEHGLRLE
jgi:hypothetical protein